MTTLLLKKQNWSIVNGCNSSFVMGRRDRERERHGLCLDSGGEFWEAAGLYIRSLVSIKSSPD